MAKVSDAQNITILFAYCEATVQRLHKFSWLVYFQIFSRMLRDSTPRFVGRSVGRSVCRLVGHILLFL